MTEGSDSKSAVLDDKFLDLKQSYELGNKAALYDAVARSNQADLGLPDWAASELQQLVVKEWKERKNKWLGTDSRVTVGYKKLLARYVRAQVYRTVRLWMKNNRHYELMPTKCIQAWYDETLNDLSNNETTAIEITRIGLLDAPLLRASKSTLMKERYFDSIPSADKLEVSDPEMAAHLDMSDDEYRNFVQGSFREFQQLPLTFGYDESEVVFGWRTTGQFWGPPPGDPPPHIQDILDAEEPI